MMDGRAYVEDILTSPKVAGRATFMWRGGATCLLLYFYVMMMMMMNPVFLVIEGVHLGASMCIRAARRSRASGRRMSNEDDPRRRRAPL